MKTCVVRKRFEPKTTSSSYNFDIQTPTGFGIPKCGICFYTNGTDNDAFDVSTLDRVFGIGFFGYSYANPATLTAYTSSIGFTHEAAVGSTQRKAVSGSNVASRIAYETRIDRNVIRQCNINSVSQDKLTSLITNYLEQKSNIIQVVESRKAAYAPLPQSIRERIVNGYNPQRSGDLMFITK
jgi:hypothetical protein